MWDGLRGGKGDLREKHGGGLGVGERQRAEKEGTRGAHARGTTPRFMFEGILHGSVPVAGRYSGRRVEYYMEGVGDLRRGVCIIRD